MVRDDRGKSTGNRDSGADQIVRRLDMLDERLDNIDSIVTNMVERVMSRPITITLVCPNCGKNIEVNIIGSGKARL